MGIKRVVDVLLRAPKDLTAAERMVLVAIGENVRDGDPSRMTWPDFNIHTLAERTGLTGKGSLKSALQRLAARGLEVRVPITEGKDGRPVFALPGTQCRYRFPAVLEGEVTTSPNDEEGEDRTSPGEVTTSPMGRPQPRQGRSGPPPTPPPSTPPPSKGAEEEEEPAGPLREAGQQQQHEDRLAAAAEFLERLPEPWTIGPVSARATAPDLISMIDRQGWDLDADLITKLTERPGGITSYPTILRIRIRDLPKRIKPAPRKPSAPLSPWCGECADGAKAAAREGNLRLIYDDHGHARPCPKCHPSQTAHAA
ncbi:MarR family transcriptional regulator [Streptomyces sp. NPDC058001]|uniref:MarR family transcriptional regulator n=1 Tax=Streptomyces sp. NPDC058001 TaxID=3346300 RepID=UPI0036EFA3F9